MSEPTSSGMTIRVRTLVIVLVVVAAGIGGYAFAQSQDSASSDSDGPDSGCLEAAQEMAEQGATRDTTGRFENSQGSIVTYDLREVFGDDAGGVGPLDRWRAEQLAEALCADDP